MKMGILITKIFQLHKEIPYGLLLATNKKIILIIQKKMYVILY